MLSLFRWIVGCWHDWDKWQYKWINVVNGSGNSVVGRARVRERFCKKCGRRQSREVFLHE